MTDHDVESPWVAPGYGDIAAVSKVGGRSVDCTRPSWRVEALRRKPRLPVACP